MIGKNGKTGTFGSTFVQVLLVVITPGTLAAWRPQISLAAVFNTVGLTLRVRAVPYAEREAYGSETIFESRCVIWQ
jgi:hypothetical protein